MSDKGWRSNKPFLSAVSRLKCWASSRHDTGRGFSNDAEILYTTLFSIVEYSDMKLRARREADVELRDFAGGSDISENRQRDLQDKVRIARSSVTLKGNRPVGTRTGDLAGNISGASTNIYQINRD